MESMENVSWLWPFKGGTWKERLRALAYVLEFVLGAVAIYNLAKALAPYF